MGVCAPWAEVDDLTADEGCAPCADIDPAVLADALMAASEILYNLSERRYPGLCTETARPCASARRGGGVHPAWHGGLLPMFPSPLGRDGLPIWGFCSCVSSSRCGCSPLQEITLGRYPIQSIESVLIDGEELADAVRVDDYRWLVRTDGGSFPCCQNLRAPLGEEGTFGVSFGFGAEPPAGGRRASMTFGCQLALAWCGRPCDFGPRVRSYTRQQVSVVLQDPSALIGGRIGIESVDLWLESERYARRRAPLTMTSPDTGKRVRRTTWTPDQGS